MRERRTKQFVETLLLFAVRSSVAGLSSFPAIATFRKAPEERAGEVMQRESGCKLGRGARQNQSSIPTTNPATSSLSLHRACFWTLLVIPPALHIPRGARLLAELCQSASLSPSLPLPQLDRPCPAPSSCTSLIPGVQLFN